MGRHEEEEAAADEEKESDCAFVQAPAAGAAAACPSSPSPFSPCQNVHHHAGPCCLYG